jgi:hypothetical protein
MKQDFGAIWAYKKDLEFFKAEADKRDLKLCSMFNRMMKKCFPKRYKEVAK